MDPLTQGLLGAALPLAVSNKRNLAVVGVLGVVSGMAPDLDVLIRSSTDPLLYLEYHRQFTHSLLFIPFGSFICALVLYPLFAKKRGLSFRQSWFYCALGYSTHALLDACTSYGTQLLWPISNTRYAWNTISVIDPAFTLPILILLLFSALKRSPNYARIAFLWCLAYLSLGMIQRDRAEVAGWEIVKERQHNAIQLKAKPSFSNLLVWKLIYETEESYYVDAVRVGRSIKIYPGESTPKLNIKEQFPWLNPQSQQARDIERFRWFSNGFVATDPNNELRIVDMRYSIVPNQINALWGINLSPKANAEAHVEYTAHRGSTAEDRQVFFNMLTDFE
ncbi:MULTISPECIES: metal-dependent hydrolase [Vibrio]|uniref:metal-dependent hydrolase n=1 Tax=Vibrio TaxID=662 RepID=UPI00046EA62E|nr:MULTISPECIES: metal-dependent hydrolase [Vibrio]EIO9261286.1 metal-dependent hydrolase [Vibrio alginolyticus]EJA7361086.1 metal-dependent hydrolase [Vibrio alginolyticus]ELB2944535.1 metal-dependent hydrolase [Vibrio alginolyticus]MBS9831060.1 metal-dependent hydrolase [Vibrio alginolyticus]MBS9968380.1 metal-dependent hydrolase [Vibrio alginolyticus]